MTGLIVFGLGAALLALMSGKKDAEPKKSAALPPIKNKTPTGPAATGDRVLPIADSQEAVATAKEAIESAQDRDWQSAVVAAIESGDAPTMQLVADTMRKDGATAQANALEEVIQQEREEAATLTNELRATAAIAANEPVPPPVTAEDIAKAEPAPAPVPVDPARVAAGELATYLASTSRYKENRDKVADYQRKIGTDPDGKYGPGTASILVTYGIIPPDVFYWPSTNTAQSVSNYAALLRTKAQQDPTRSEQWLAAAARAGR